MSRNTRFATLVVVAAVFAPAAGAWTSPPVYVHSPGANGTAYLQALTPQRVLSMRRAAQAVLITDNSPSQNRVSARNTHRAFRTVFDATK